MRTMASSKLQIKALFDQIYNEISRDQYAITFNGKSGKKYKGAPINIDVTAFRLLKSLCAAVKDEERVFDINRVSFIYS